ncbi:hypothetical protein RBH20_09720 [Haloarcula sp. H-GB4]|uniref:hypothetical protein n=1 Tax=Haloarcula sp. H-GB4 TaxID=3069755 RepID=UPI0027B6E1CA|nr:hypothetical protein [Haloarcula sp. H-GB4]MDQ2072811.1 hypothetical protein [Haloarcula sp. H-GB4]
MRRSKRELHRALDNLTEDSDSPEPSEVVWEDEAGEWYDSPDKEGKPLDPDAVDPAIVMSETIVETDWELNQ